MRALLLHNQIAPYRVPLFGALARYVQLEVQFCYARGSDRLWQADLEACDFAYKVLAGPVCSVVGRSFYLRSGPTLDILRRDFDVVVLTLNYETALTTYIASLAARARRVPVVLWIADTDQRYFTPQRAVEKLGDALHRRIKGSLVTHAAKVVAYSVLAKQHVVETLGRRADDVFVGSQVWPRLAAPPAHDFAQHPFNFVYLGYLNERKRVSDLIAALSQVPDPAARLIIAGDGPEKQILQSMAAHDQRISFRGYMEGDAKRDLLSQAHAFVMPSAFDNMPNSVLEAMAYALPIIATHECYCPEWLGDNALTYHAGDVATVRAHMQALLSDRQAAARMAEKSLILANRYDIDFAVKAFYGAMTAAAEGRKHGRQTLAAG